jgi:hypothetical protein
MRQYPPAPTSPPTPDQCTSSAQPELTAILLCPRSPKRIRRPRCLPSSSETPSSLVPGAGLALGAGLSTEDLAGGSQFTLQPTLQCERGEPLPPSQTPGRLDAVNSCHMLQTKSSTPGKGGVREEEEPEIDMPPATPKGDAKDERRREPASPLFPPPKGGVAGKRRYPL